MKRKKNGTCVLCGDVGHMTKEHAPPRVAFPKPRPNNCITVPTCNSCNNDMADLDEDFGNFLAVLAGHSSEEGSRLMKDRLPAIWKNEKKYQNLKDSISAVPRSDGNTDLPPEHYLVRLEPKKFEPIYDKCFRALYYKKYDRIYPHKYSFDFFYPRNLNGMHEIFLNLLHTRNVGANDVFFCGVAQTEENPDVFGALLLFYNQFLVVGMTTGLERFAPNNQA